MTDEPKKEQEPKTFAECLSEVTTEKRQKFVIEFLVDFIGSRAAERAGYAEASSHVEASRLRKDPTVKAAIEAGMREMAEDASVPRSWVLRRLRMNAVDAAKKGNTQASNQALATIAKATGMLDKDLNVNLRGDVAARVVMHFPDNQRGQPEGNGDGEGDEGGSEGS